MTPHIEASVGDYAPTVLLAGDPARVDWIARTFLEDARCVNRIRSCLGFTGHYRGTPLSLQATGMGCPSLSIYAHELLEVYGVKSLIRVGTCGGLSSHVGLRSLVLSIAASSDSAIDRQIFGPFNYAPSADFGLLRRAAAIAEKMGLPHLVGRTASSDVFYHIQALARFDMLRQHGVIAVDMETSALYSLAARFGARALSICTVVDNPVTQETTAFSERQELFGPMARLALEVAAEEGTDHG